GCGPTSFAMVASYLTGKTITPVDAVSWCGNSYYKPGVGTYWSYFAAAASHFGCGSVTQTTDPNRVLKALSEGHPVISSQSAGLFTRGGHFIVLRGVTASGKVLVNDPNDSASKNYINREFDMMSEIHATASAYWIFDKK
ncbi:MAG: C39 family peptidase, partial [Blautia sp.]|nr:C39 family peptidase [Blautia sp.]